jgi:hypothetical protein
MRKLRFNIANLRAVVFILGVGFAALRDSSDLWESGIFTLTLAALLISIPLAVYRLGSRRAFWLGFALFGWIYLGLSLVPSIESRLFTTNALGYLDSKVLRPTPDGLAYFDNDNDGLMDLDVVNNSQPNALFLNKGNGTFEDVTAAVGSNPAGGQASFSNVLAGPSLKGSIGTTENFVRIGHSLLAFVAAHVGGRLSEYLHTKNSHGTSAPVPPPVSIWNDSGV